MDIGSIFLILAVLIPVIIFLYRPFMERSTATVVQANKEFSTLLAERDQAIALLQDLDDDYNLGKIPEATYTSQRQVLLLNGADILRQIDAYQSSPAGSAAEDRMEAAIAARKVSSEGNQGSVRKNGNAVRPVPDDDLEQKIASRRRSMQGKAGGFCPKCGHPVQADDRFCPKCGANLS